MERVIRGISGSPWRGIGGRLVWTVALTWAVTQVALGQEAPAADPAQALPPVTAPTEGEAAPTPEVTPAEAADAAQGDQPADVQTPVEGDPPADTADTTTETDTGTETDAEAATAGKGLRWIRGSFDAGFDGVWDDDSSDVNLDQTLRIQIDPPQYPRLHLRGSLWMDEDLDSDSYEESAIRDYNDTYNSGVRANLLYLYADIDDLWGDSVLRLGRQRIVESPLYNRVDGLYFKQRLANWDWYVFGGARGSIYFDTHDDEVYGGGVSWQATPTTRIALDGFYGDEERGKSDEVRVFPLYRLFDLQYPRRVYSEVDDNYFSLSLWQWFAPNINVFGRFGVQNGEADDLLIDVNGVIEGWDLSYEVAYRAQLQENKDQVNDLTAYYRILGEYEEYDNILLALHKPLNKILTLSVEAEFNNSQAGDREEQANRDYDRYAIILSADELVPTVDASVGFEYWNVSEDEGTWAVTGEVSKQWDRFKLTLGADYERYEDRLVRYNGWPGFLTNAPIGFVPGYFAGYRPWVGLIDTYAVETHLDIQSIYAQLKYELNKDQDVSLKVTYEEDDAPESPYWRVQAGYTINF